MLKILEDLVTLARERKNNPVKGSYTNKLLEDKSLAKEKVLEEINAVSYTHLTLPTILRV